MNTVLRASALLLLLAAPLRADVNGDLAFSSFSSPDLNALSSGQVLQKSGGLINFPRGIVVQALYVVDTDPASVQKKLLTWDPASHPELKVWMHKSLPAKPALADFSALASLPDNTSVAALRTATAKLTADAPGDLQVSKDEAQSIATAMKGGASTAFSDAWSQVLAGRMNSFLAGTAANDVYQTGDGKVMPLDDVRHLLHTDTKVYGQFQRFFNQTPLKAGTAPSVPLAPANLYYECFDVQDFAAMGTGAIYQHADGATIQSADFEFYVNSGIYASVELEQLWPVTINGKNETLVWREDLVSAPDMAGRSGSERLAAGMIMLQDVKQAVDAFKAEFK